MNPRHIKTGLRQARALCTLLALSGSLVLDATAAEGANPELGPSTFELVPYQASGYRFKVIGLTETPPPGFERPGFDESGFALGDAAFGAVDFGGGCPLQPSVQTPWPVNSQLLVRGVATMPAGATNVRVMVSVDNDIVGVFFNGVSISGPIVREGCSIRDEFRFDVPPSLAHPGENLVAFHVRDRGAASFFDARVLAELSLPALTTSLANLSSLVDRQLPRVPLDNISLDCRPGGAQDVLLTYDVLGTGARAAIQVNRHNTTDFTARYLLDGSQISTVQSTTNESRTRTNIATDLTVNNQADLTNAASFVGVLGSPGAVEPLFTCLQTSQQSGQSCFEKARTEQECSSCCMQAGDTGRKLCGAGSAGIGGLGGLIVALVGFFFGDTCNDGIQAMENKCIRQCRGEEPPPK